MRQRMIESLVNSSGLVLCSPRGLSPSRQRRRRGQHRHLQHRHRASSGSPLRYTHPVGPAADPTHGGAGAATWAAISAGRDGCLYGWQTTSLDNYIGFFFHPQIGAMLSLDLGYGRSTTTTTPFSNGGPRRWSTPRFFQFGFALGGKFYLTRPTAQRVSPYLYVDIFKYFASISTNNQTRMVTRWRAQAGLHVALRLQPGVRRRVLLHQLVLARRRGARPALRLRRGRTTTTRR